jgi:hypothetical protein
MKCQCRLCRSNPLLDLMIARGNPTVLLGIIWKLRNDLCCVEQDLNVHEAILDGSWPGAWGCAERILERVAEREGKEKELSNV